MQPIVFDKNRAEQLLDCLGSGKPIEPGDDSGWTHYDILRLAGVCFYAATTQGAVLHSGVDVESLSSERREAIFDTLVAELHAVIQEHAMFVQLVQNDKYDDQFDPVVSGFVQSDGENHRFIVKSGRRRHSDDQTGDHNDDDR